jgi:hypothetical protein
MQLFIMNASSARLVHFEPAIHAGKFIISSLIPIIVFCVFIESLVGRWRRGGKIIGETAYFVCCAFCLKHISVLNSDTLKVVITEVAETAKLSMRVMENLVRVRENVEAANGNFSLLIFC